MDKYIDIQGVAQVFKTKKGPFTADTEWYDKAYQRFSIVLRQPQPKAPLPKPNIPKGRGLNS